MALPSGTRLGPYEVTAQIGVGGMGEVYKATDTNLKRAVAIKVLPTPVASDAERPARFQREARKFSARSIIRTSRRSMAWSDRLALPRW
jgi:eukaryotic-like serine/threonine-protein kinase